MSSQGCFTIVVNGQDQILLVKRKDYPLWDFPGGRLEDNEKLEDCAIRETYEETGYKVIIEQKIGEYHFPYYDDIQHIFKARIVGGKAIQNGGETAKVEWFHPRKVPLFLIPNRKHQIQDFLNSKTNVQRSLKVPFMVRLLKKK
ncbi:ADP-ribose pyrophosphatase YjhB, NUDIX family [Bacillus sp. cl95]|nr:NUDIX hydrolase [Bacillus sp. UNCCL13]SFA90641.1 ADP-ribose pyrophosphatase YjhB, NUDIX family [Bacillus sp. UNCCL13]SFQ85326.1 ADP-ribose pyrophosphatase YjhB, NUDIX family [Bacillus sp. cl95]